MKTEDDTIHCCCLDHPKKFLIKFSHGGVYRVCGECYKIPQWSEGMESKEKLK